MIYKINEHLRYDPLSATLYSPHHHDNTITLSRANNGILLLFVTHNNQLLSRDYILNEIWESHGLDSSNNNLNNNLSLLRKSLAICGCDDIIKTVPKKGLVFSANSIDTLPRENKKITPDNTLKKRNNLSSINNKQTKKYFSLLFLFITSFTFILSAPYYHSQWKLTKFRSELFRIGKCRIYITDSETKLINKDDVRKHINEIMKKNVVDCNNVKSNIYFFYRVYNDAINRNISTQLISFCPYNSSAPCINYREYHLK
ncbi:TPA: winged helix-turn-helix domain-containing protein [Enterobacter kobei]|uniref:winged helix-turn-helix domain-containing protein n=1 Tax=Enterobacter kobei TaxID=208224 RepID=UPI002B1915B2|nr:winged helix-turn-helix domain-containing protein [Enterobacter kobei]HCM9166473.1 winged helix-turn-helix domain-containing protein [Enterobacter kobei]HEP0934957.1 winged helix-turn-helix domain-containing protein [Enterobacter roggenkampii]